MRLPRLAAGAVGIAALAFLFRLPPPPPFRSAPPPRPPLDAGPAALAIPPDAVVAEDAAALARLLADPSGPTSIWLRARVYEGDFVVERPLALHGTLGATLRGTGHGTVLSVDANDVTIDNLAIEHSGRRHTTEDGGVHVKGARIRLTRLSVADVLFGISLGPCESCLVERARVEGLADTPELQGDAIKLWESSDSIVRGCVVDHARDVVVWYSRRVLLEDNTVRHSRYGTHFMYAHDSIVRGSVIEDDVVGIFVMYSARLRAEGNVLAGARGAAGVGIGFKESDGVQVKDNWIVANTTGVYLDRTPRSAASPVAFDHNVLALNDVAARFLGAEEGLSFTDNDFRDNVVAAEVEGGGDALSTRFAGNTWSDYVGYDLDHDGRGDVPFQIRRLSGELTDAHPALRFFTGTGAMGLIEVIARAVPVLASHLLLEDRSPRVAMGGT